MDLEYFARLLRDGELPARLDLIQLSRPWREDDPWMDLRDRIDALLFSLFLHGARLTVRRIVYLDIPADEKRDSSGAKALTDAHREWVDGLVRDLHYLDMPSRGERATYRIKQLILDPHHDGAQSDITDGWSATDDGRWPRLFSQTWSLPACIENNLMPPELPVGPIGDRNPRWYLWRC